ncbi:MAG: hypothetical protein J07HQX50_00992 [Haloquadratum sp. J07HQX50]|nr:MAG: hypothetical protein J07HQX50_00992 [Haloquadratum sp. J07HQX50]
MTPNSSLEPVYLTSSSATVLWYNTWPTEDVKHVGKIEVGVGVELVSIVMTGSTVLRPLI